MTASVAQLAGWDDEQLRGSVGLLGGVVDRLTPWRTQLDALGRQLGTAECWSGPAGTAAAAALVELSTVASGVSGALAESLVALQGLLTAAAEARMEAAGALARAAAAGLTLDATAQPVDLPPPPDPLLPPDAAARVLAVRYAGQLAAAQAAEAIAAAARAWASALAAQAPLAGIGALDGAVVAFDGLAVRLSPAFPLVPGPPPVLRPVETAQWWAGLTAAEQLAQIHTHPGTVGGLEGVPAWARDRANRMELETALQQLPAGEQRDMAQVVAHQLAAEDDAGRTAQLLQFDPAADLVAVSLGDLDTAAAVGVLVPGINTTPADDLGGVLGDARDLASAAAGAAPGLAVATVAWLGYRTPGTLTSLSPAAAAQAGPALDRALDGLAAARSGAGPAPRTTVLAHSYGTTVTGAAALAPGPLAADAVVLLGSPGTGVGRADRLEAGEVYGAWSAADLISTSDYYGPSPFDPLFGDLPLPTELGQGHSDYYDTDRPTLAAMGEVVAGVQDGD